MKKIALLSGIIALSCIFGYNQKDNLKEIVNSNVESLADGEGELTRNYIRTPVWYNSSVSAGLKIGTGPSWFELTFGGTWTKYMCCCPGTNMDGCDFTLEDAKCKQLAIR